jgi:C-terminal processing protease CtpA/Prc
MHFEESAVPYLPILRRRTWRRRLLITALVVVVAVPYIALRLERASQPIGARLVDQIASTISLRYYDANFHGVAWQAVVTKYRPLVARARTREERYALLQRMVATLSDSHTAIFSPTDLAHVRATRGTVVTRAASSSTDDESLVSWRVPALGVGYVRLGAFPDTIAPVLQWAMEEAGRFPALVLDLRGNPGGLVDSVDATAGLFLPAGTLISSGTRRFHPFGAQRFRATTEAGMTYSGHLVVIVDRTTESGAESLARALQFYRRATIVGTRTAGKVLGVDVEVTLEDGGLLRVATLNMFAPDGKRLEGTGVQPDVVVGRASAAATGERDAQLSAAIRLARQSLPAATLRQH